MELVGFLSYDVGGAGEKSWVGGSVLSDGAGGNWLEIYRHLLQFIQQSVTSDLRYPFPMETT